MFRNFKMVDRVVFGRGCFNQLGDILSGVRKPGAPVVFLVDDLFEHAPLAGRIPVEPGDQLIWV
ncbi:MAG: alcohol dehydrogenase, partial [Proteobacteria bacterium]|nr:alcohol dehydrogenase [Pseudomonadota bacterium]